MRDKVELFALILLMIAVFAGIFWAASRESAPEPPRTAEPTPVLVDSAPVCPDSADFLRQKPSPTAKIPHAEADSQESLPPAGICWANPAGEGEICTYWLGE
jgi:hypothetical protein